VLARSTSICVADVGIFRHLKVRSGSPPIPFETFSSLLVQVTRLSLHTKLPLRLFQCLDTAAEHTDASSQDFKSSWIQLGSIATLLPRITRLELWLDHDEPCDWTVINERGIISPLNQLSDNGDLEVSISLPKLHPRFETESRHFTSDGMPTPFDLHRRFRQRHHGRITSRGLAEVLYKPEYPYLVDVIGYHEMSVAELEAEERDWWKEGGDVEAAVRKVSPLIFEE
jgi:hypothetical protein